ncbi:MAG: hypothetical protein K2G38_06155 [Clostridia bacterium]|nr:hypothetical protein [Clostridia bacterium]
MEQIKFYYRFKAIAVDFLDEKEIKKYSEELSSFSCLDGQFAKLKSAYENAEKERADIIVNAMPDISGVIELQVFHNIKYKLFSHTVKRNSFSLCVTQFDESNHVSLYFYDTLNFNEVKQIFENFISNKTIPDLSKWNKKFIG